MTIWNDDNDGFRDMPIERDEKGNWKDEPDDQQQFIDPPRRPRSTGQAPVPARPKRPAPKPEPEIEYDEEAIASTEEDDFSEVLSDASLRLEQGTLYKLIMNSSLFKDADCDPRAVKNVEREMKRFARERMEVMLGMRQEKMMKDYADYNAAMAPSPFNSLEVQVLKQVAAAASKGATELPEAEEIAQKIEKRPPTSFSPISAGKPRPAQAAATPAPRPAPKPLTSKPATPLSRKPKNEIDEIMDGNLTKPLHKMTEEELAAHNAEANERRRPRAKAENAVPQPLGDQLYSLHATRESQMDPKAANAVAMVMAAMANKK